MSNDLVSPNAVKEGYSHMLVTPLATCTLLSSCSFCVPLMDTLLWSL